MEQLSRDTKNVASGSIVVGDLSDLTKTLGFSEDKNLLALRAEVVEAITAGRVDPAREAWSKYVEAALREHVSNTGIAVAQGLICLEAGDLVSYIQYLLMADRAASTDGRSDVADRLGEELKRFKKLPQYHHANANFERTFKNFDAAASLYDDAIISYVQAELIASSDHERGVANFRLAQCYAAQLELEPGEANMLNNLIVSTLRAAAGFLDGLPGQAMVAGMMDDLSRQTWWLQNG